MTSRFFITGLPRSRTAWFSVATTTSTSVCFHEPLSALQSFDALREFWAPKFGVDIGISDSGLAPQAERILEELNPRTLIVERPLGDAAKSFERYARINNLAYDLDACALVAAASIKALGKIRHHPLVKTVAFAALDDYTIMADAMSWLLPDREFSDLRALMTMNIQVSAAHVKAQIGKPHTFWHLECFT